MKQSAMEFLQHQKDAMSMIAKVTRSIYQILETIAEREIERDPIAHIREQSFIQPVMNKNRKGGDVEEEEYKDLDVMEFDCDGEMREVVFSQNKNGRKKSSSK